MALTFPVIAHPASVVAHDGGDPILNTWILWWSTQATPFTARWWSAPIFFPMANALALSEILVGLLPISAPVQWLTHSPLAAYNVTVLVSFPFCALATYALALELTGRRDAAFVAGLAFACAPYRMAQLSHVQMLSYYWRRWRSSASIGISERAVDARAVRCGLADAVAVQRLRDVSSVRAGRTLDAVVRARHSDVRRGAGRLGAGGAAMIPALLIYRNVHAYCTWFATSTQSRRLAPTSRTC